MRCGHKAFRQGCHLCWLAHSHSEKGVQWRNANGVPHPPADAPDPGEFVVTNRLIPADGRRIVIGQDRSLPCLHLGEQTGEKRQCKTCTKSVQAKLRRCAIAAHPLCHETLRVGDGVACCQDCPDYQAAPEVEPVPTYTGPPCPELVPGVADPLPEPVLRPRSRSWPQKPEVRDRHVAAFRKLLAAESPPPERADGDGVVYVGGGRYWPMIVVALRMLREVSSLPVQVWYRGTEEPVNPADVADLDGISLHDATQIRPAPRTLGGWELKTLALLHCGWRRAIYLDADAYVVNDPATLLDLASQHRFAYWSDLPNTVHNLKPDAYGVTAESVHRVPTVQGGQLALDLVTFRRELLLAHWLNQHSDYFYSHSYGDQDQWRVTLAATGGVYRCLGSAPWQQIAFVCHLDGKPIVVHRCQSKLLLAKDVGRDEKANRRLDSLPGEAMAWKWWERVRERRGY